MLLKHLNLLLRPDSGKIVIDGVDVTRLSNRGLDEVRKKFGMLFQAGALFDSMSVFDNVAFPLVENTGMKREEIAVKVRRRCTTWASKGWRASIPRSLAAGCRSGRRSRARSFAIRRS